MGYNKFPDLGCSASQGIIRNTLWGLSCNFLSTEFPVNTGERFRHVLPRNPACLCWYSIGRIDYGYGLNDPSEGGTLPRSHGRNIMGMFRHFAW